MQMIKASEPQHVFVSNVKVTGAIGYAGSRLGSGFGGSLAGDVFRRARVRVRERARLHVLQLRSVAARTNRGSCSCFQPSTMHRDSSGRTLIGRRFESCPAHESGQDAEVNNGDRDDGKRVRPQLLVDFSHR